MLLPPITITSRGISLLSSIRSIPGTRVLSGREYIDAFSVMKSREGSYEPSRIFSLQVSHFSHASAPAALRFSGVMDMMGITPLKRDGRREADPRPSHH